MDLAEGLTITESIRLVRKLGDGGMGSLWVAEHLALNTQVAVKFMSQETDNAAAVARFKREAMAAAQIRSPHVVQIFDHGLLDQGLPYIVMELLEGENLSSRIRKERALSASTTAQVVVQMGKALGKAHARGVVHRDVKPDNVFLVDAEGDIFIKLLDFGIAKATRDNIHITSTGAVVGTPHYMSPEQLLSAKGVDARCDLWALGVVAYECLTGEVPFTGETFGGVAISIVHDSLKLPYAHRGVGSPALDAWFARALAKDASARFASAREAADAFAAAAADLPSKPGAGVSPTVPDAFANPAVELEPAPAPRAFNGAAKTLHSPPSGRFDMRVAFAVALLTSIALGVVVSRLRDKRAQVSRPSISSQVAPAKAPRVPPVAIAPRAEAPLAPVPPLREVDAGARERGKAENMPARRSRTRPLRSRPAPLAEPADQPEAAPARPDRGF